MKKEFEIQSINHALYDARNNKKVTLKEAAKALRISKLHLKLIERGYLHVSKKLQPRFVAYYRLNKDFFSMNTTYVDPVNVTYEDPELDKKIRAKIKKRKTKIISGVISALLLGVLGTGLYYYCRYDANPRSTWTNELTTFRNQFIAHPEVKTEASLEYPGDTIYYIEKRVESDRIVRFSILANDINITGSSVHLEYKSLNINASVYNKKKILELEQLPPKSLEFPYHFYGICTYTKRNVDYNLPKITVKNVVEDVTQDFRKGDDLYDMFYELVFGEYDAYGKTIESANTLLNDLGFNYNYDQLLDDVQRVSEYEVHGFRLGFRLILFPAIFLVLSLSIFIYALYKGRKIKPKKEKVAKPYVVHKTEYTADAELVYRSVPNDTKFPMVVPEFVLRIIALGFLLFASIGSAWLTESTLMLENSLISEIGGAYISNLLVSGITLAFFLKLDVCHKKSNRELLENIVTLFVFGLMFYIAECITYACLSSQGSIYGKFAGLLTTLLPGNIIWNLMLYSSIFFFLFTLPKKIEDAPHKVLLWRLGSVIPTLLLLVAFIYQGTFKGAMPVYVSFLFHTNGILCTAFAIFYLYALFFFQQYVSLKYGKEFAKVFLDSRRYALEKNMIACIVLTLLVLIDLLFYFYLPFNDFKLGNNWIIAILIPFILLYRPHIGKRSPKWDLIYTALYVLFLTGGFVISFGMIANTLDLSQIAQIIN